MAEPFVIYGAGGFAREVAWLAEDCGYQVAAFIDDEHSRWGQSLNGVPVVSLDTVAADFPKAQVAIALGNPRTRAALCAKVRAAGLRLGTLIHPRVERSRWITFGEGVVICAGTTLTTNIKVGEQVQVNLHCTIGHDAVLEDFVTLAPGVHVSGCVHLGRSSYVGTGAVIINGTAESPLKIGEGAVIGAGACVVKSVDPGLTVGGVPAKPLVPRS